MLLGFINNYVSLIWLLLHGILLKSWGMVFLIELLYHWQKKKKTPMPHGFIKILPHGGLIGKMALLYIGPVDILK